jgi:putative ABC transport system permease protein
VALSELSLPLFNSLSGKELGISSFDNLFLLFGLFSIILIVGLISGIFPAFYTSALQPVKALRGMLKASSIISILRRYLVVTQFSISIVFIISTVVVFSQLDYIRSRKLGFQKEHIVNIPIHDKGALQRYETIKSEFLKDSSVLAVSASNFFPGKNVWYQSYWREGARGDENLMISWMTVDHDFLETFQIRLVEGRNFSRDFPNDVEGGYILNESAVKEMGWDVPLGKEFKILEKGRVIGVVEDFHFKSLHQEIKPVALCIYPQFFESFSVKISPVRISRTLDFLKNKWQELVPGQSFEYSFLDEDFGRLYEAEMRLSRIFSIVAALAVFIACLGLFGLAAFMAEQRAKEVGIRKVLGATVSNIIIMLSTEFSKWVLMANIIAWPVAYYAMHQWLQNFAYRTDMALWMFLSAAMIALVIAWLTVSYQAFKVALTSPGESLRYE